jgi:hypothetical protein
MALGTYASGCLLVLGSALIAVVGLLITRKLLDLEQLKSSHEVGGYLLSVIGTLYAVLLGLVVVDSMQRFQHAREVTEREANNLADVFLLSSTLPEPKRSEVRQACIDYSEDVINEEWRNMDNGVYCPKARKAAIELIKRTMDFEPKTESEKALFPIMVSEATQVWENRRVRINMAVNGIPAAEWAVLIIGAVVTVFFTYFFGINNLRLQITMTSMVAMLISLNLDLVLLFGYPFSGDLSIHVDSFQLDRNIFADKISVQH